MEKLKVSVMTGKLKGLNAINTSPLDNPFCIRMRKTNKVCKHCYSCKMLETSRKNCRPAWKRNGILLSTKKVGIDFTMPKIKSEIVRLSAHGELFNIRHMDNLMSIVKYYPDKMFTLWSKRSKLVKRYFTNNVRPDNLITIYSDENLNSTCDSLPVSFNKRFIVNNTSTDKVINCGAKNCMTCKLCYTHNDTTIVNELLK